MDDMGYCRDVSFWEALCTNATKLRFDHAVREEGSNGRVVCLRNHQADHRNESGIMGWIDEDGQEIYF